MRACLNCDGEGLVVEDLTDPDERPEYCFVCEGTGYDLLSCESCDEDGVGFTEDGEFLCEDCLFESMIED